MPKLGTPDFMAWLTVILIQPTIVLWMIRIGTWKQWPSLWSYLAWQTLKSFVLLALYLQGKEAAYFYTYWIGGALSEVFQVWILIQISHELFGITPAIRKQLRNGIMILILVVLICCSIFASKVKLDAQDITQTAIWMDRSVSLAWCIAFLIVALSASFVGMRWRKESLGVASGFALNSSGSIIFAWAITAFGIDAAQAISGIKEFFYLFSLVAWSVSIWKQGEHLIPPPETLSVTRKHLLGYLHLLHRKKQGN